MGGASEGIAVVEVEVVVLLGIPVMGTVHVVAVVFLEEEVTTTSMIGAGDLEAEVLDEEVDEAEALGEGEIGVQLGKGVLREGQRLNCGTRKGTKESLEEVIPVQEVGGTGAPLEKAVPKEGQRSSNGTGKGNWKNLQEVMTLLVIMRTEMVLGILRIHLMMAIIRNEHEIYRHGCK